MNGCASMKAPKPTIATIQGVSGHFRIGQIIDLDKGKALSFDQLIHQIASNDLIFIGEVHDNPEHHLIQVQILQALLSCCGPVTIAMESFEKSNQEFLDQYLNGELSEPEFLKEVGWRGGWKYDYHLYRPLLLLARQNGSRILAINAPNDIVKNVARHGLKSLDPDDRNRLADDIDLNNKAHNAYLRKAYEHHSKIYLKKFDYFYEAQCVWEDTMAHNIAGYMRENRKKMVVLAGNGHVINKFGIPDRTTRHFPVSMVTIMPFPLNGNIAIKKETADYAWLTPHFPHRFRIFNR